MPDRGLVVSYFTTVAPAQAPVVTSGCISPVSRDGSGVLAQPQPFSYGSYLKFEFHFHDGTILQWRASK